MKVQTFQPTIRHSNIYQLETLSILKSEWLIETNIFKEVYSQLVVRIYRWFPEYSWTVTSHHLYCPSSLQLQQSAIICKKNWSILWYITKYIFIDCNITPPILTVKSATSAAMQLYANILKWILKPILIYFKVYIYRQ